MNDREHAVWSEAQAWAPACSGCDGDLEGGWCEPCQRMHLDPQPGPQCMFLACPADVVLYGGAAGGGKTWSLLLDALRYAVTVDGWNGLIVRRIRESMTVGGGIWAQAKKVFGREGVEYNESSLTVRWVATGSTLSFRQVLHNPGLFAGPSYDWIGIEELQEITVDDMILALTRLRSTSGIRPTLRATCNPRRGHKIVDWIRWYLNADGTPDRSKGGVVRYFARSSKTNAFCHAATPEEAEVAAGRPRGSAQSFAFVPSLLADNPALDKVDPNYRNKIALQGRVAEAQLGDGNWFVGDDAGGPLERGRWVHVVAPLSPIVRWVRAWDKAATRPSESNKDPDYTIGFKLGFDAAGRFYIVGLAACREDTPLRDVMIAATASADGHMCQQVHKQAPGDAGKSDVVHTRPLLAQSGGLAPVHLRESKNKVIRVTPLARALELGMRNGRPVDVENPPSEGDWEPRGFVLDSDGWLLRPYSDAGSHPETIGDLLWEHLDPFPNGAHDDAADAAADAFEVGAAGPGRQVTAGARGSRYASGR
jgi:phage terminase large subunit-like protein